MAKFELKNRVKTSMSKKAKLIILSIVGVLFLLTVGIILISNYGGKVAFANVQNYCFDDEAVNVFTAEQELQINQKCKQVQDKYGVDVYVATCRRIGASATLRGTDFLSEHGFNESDNLIVLIINARLTTYQILGEPHEYISEYHFDLYAYGKCRGKITQSEVKKILYSNAGDNILEGGNLTYEGTTEMVGLLGKAYHFIYNESWKTILIVGAVVAFVGSLITILVISGKYKKERYVSNYDFNANSKLNLEHSSDVFTHKSVTYVRINTDNGSGGLSIGGGSGGGGGSGHLGGR